MIKKEMIRMTRQRKVILDELTKVDSHPSADEVYQMVRKVLPKVSLATVYRNLESLSEGGLIRKIEMTGSQKRFDAITRAHHHVRCTSCGRVADIHEGPETSHLEGSVRSEFTITGHRLEFTGICPQCSNKAQQDY